MTAMLRPATPADRPDLIALALAEDAAWSGAPEVSGEEAGEFIDHHGPGVSILGTFHRDPRMVMLRYEDDDRPRLSALHTGERRRRAQHPSKRAVEKRLDRGKSGCGFSSPVDGTSPIGLDSTPRDRQTGRQGASIRSAPVPPVHPIEEDCHGAFTDA